MTLTVVIILATASALATGSGCALAWVNYKRATEPPAPPPDPVVSWWESLIRTQVLVHTHDNATLRGFVDRLYDGAVAFVGAEWLPDEGPEVELAGTIIMDFTEIRFVQIAPRPRHRRSRSVTGDGEGA